MCVCRLCVSELRFEAKVDFFVKAIDLLKPAEEKYVYLPISLRFYSGQVNYAFCSVSLLKDYSIMSNRCEVA